MSNRMITLGIYFEVHDAEMYGGEGSVGYVNINIDLKASALAKVNMDEYLEKQKQGVAEMCKTDKEKVIIIPRTQYESETEDEYDDEDWHWYDYCGV